MIDDNSPESLLSGDFDDHSRTTAGGVIWLTGLSSAGKTTLAKALRDRFLDHGVTPVVLDGNEVRDALGVAHKFDVSSRRRMAFTYARLCRLLAAQGHVVICATISLFHEVHHWNRTRNPRYVEVFLDVPVEELQRRDTRAVYEADGEHAVGVGIPAEFPQTPDLVIKNHQGFDLGQAVDWVLQTCADKGLAPTSLYEPITG